MTFYSDYHLKQQLDTVISGGSSPGVVAVAEWWYAPTAGSTTTANYAGYSLRNFFPANQLPFSGTKVRIGIPAVTVQSLVVDHASVVESTTPPNGDTVPTEFLFNGDSGFTTKVTPVATLGLVLWSDWLTYTWDTTKGHLFIFDVNGAGTQKFKYLTGLTNYVDYYKSGSASCNVKDVTGYSNWLGEIDVLCCVQIA